MEKNGWYPGVFGAAVLLGNPLLDFPPLPSCATWIPFPFDIPLPVIKRVGDSQFLHPSLPGTTSPNSKPPNCFGRRVLCVGVLSPNLFGCLPVFGLRLGEGEPNRPDDGLEVGNGLCENVTGANVDWNTGREVGTGLGEKVAGAKVD